MAIQPKTAAKKAKKEKKIQRLTEELQKAKDEALDVRKPRNFFNLKSIIEVTGINPDKVYNNFKGIYNSLTDEEKKRIATCLMIPTATIFETLGMKVQFSKLDSNGSNKK